MFALTSAPANADRSLFSNHRRLLQRSEGDRGRSSLQYNEPKYVHGLPAVSIDSEFPTLVLAAAEPDASGISDERNDEKRRDAAYGDDITDMTLPLRAYCTGPLAPYPP